MSDYQSLIERVEGLSGPCRETDCRIAYALGMNWCNPKWSNSLHNWRQHVETHGFEAAWTSDHVYRSGYDSPPPEDFGGSLVPNWTASIDAALSLVERKLPGWFVTIDKYIVTDDPKTRGCWRVWLKQVIDDDALPDAYIRKAFGRGDTPALALILALLRALQSQEEG